MNLESLIPPSDLKFEQNDPNLPQHPFRLGVFGPSSSGKTYVLFDLLLQGRIYFDKLYLYVADPREKKWSFLINFYNDLAKESGLDVETFLTISDDPDDIIAVDDLDRTKQNLVIFDDFVIYRKAMKGVISEHFLRGRKMNTSYCFLSQSYYDVPKLVRNNMKEFVLFGFPQKRENSAICSEMSVTCDFDEFKSMYKEATSQDHGWLYVDRSTKDPRKAIRFKFDGFRKTEKVE